MTDKIKILIGDDSSEYGLTWASLLKKEGMFTAARHKNGRVILESVKNDMPDFLIIEAKMPELDAASLLDEIRAAKGTVPVTVVVSNINTPELEKEVMDAGASYFMVKPISPENLESRINEVLGNSHGRSESKQLDEKISNIFISIGIPAHIKGYQFLREAVKLAVEEPEIIGSITKKLYPTIAEKFETSSSKVERGMRHAIEVAWNRGKIENINNIFGLKIYNRNEKPTNGELIALIADKMIMDV